VTIDAGGAHEVTEERIAGLARDVIEKRSRTDEFGPAGRPNNEAPRADS
jgi:proteasome beta subunit